MRFVPLLMLTLLMIGFAARPTVSAALTDGHVLMHPFAMTSVVSLEDTSEGDGHVTVTKCVSLGVLPCGWTVTAPPNALVATVPAASSQPVDQVYSILRPPRTLA